MHHNFFIFNGRVWGGTSSVFVLHVVFDKIHLQIQNIYQSVQFRLIKSRQFLAGILYFTLHTLVLTNVKHAHQSINCKSH